MSDLTSFRASIKRMIETDDVAETLAGEGLDLRSAQLVGVSKAFRASRSVTQLARKVPAGQAKK